MSRCGLAIAACFVVGMGPAVAFATEPAPVGTDGVLEVDYIIEGKHSSKVDTDSLDWTVKRQLNVVYHLRAGELSIAGVSDPEHQESLAAESAALSAQGEAAMTDNADVLAQMEREVDACGDNEACLTAMAMKMAGQPGMQSLGTAAAGMSQSAKTFQAGNPPRFQIWSGGDAEAASGSAEAIYEESLKRVVYDPICTKTNNICTSTRVRTGKQTYPTLGAAAPGIPVPTVEIDTKKDLISVMLSPPLVQTTVQQTVVETPEMESGEAGARTVELVFAGNIGQKAWDELRMIGVPLAGASNSARGEKVVTLPDLDDYRAPLNLTVRWRFRRS